MYLHQAREGVRRRRSDYSKLLVVLVWLVKVDWTVSNDQVTFCMAVRGSGGGGGEYTKSGSPVETSIPLLRTHTHTQLLYIHT